MRLTGFTVLRHLCAALAAGLVLPATAADPSLLDALNAARSAGCGGKAGAGVELRESSRLSDATRKLAQGAPYKDALAMSGYRAMRSATIRLRGDLSPPVVVDAVVKTSCAQLADTELREVGIYHEGRDGSTPAVRATRAGYKWQMVAENIAFGVMTPEAAVEGWLKSPPHCTALMAPQFTEMGVAFAVNPSSDAGIYWGQMFGTPRQ